MTLQPLTEEDLDKLAGEFLTLIELEEARLLSWGFVRVQNDLEMTLPPILERLSPIGRALWNRAQETGVTINDILTNLDERRLIFRNRNGLYRSRFAESVRLLFLLRQLMPRMAWQDAPRLVSDLRLHLQRRRYPERSIPGSTLLAALEKLDASEFELDVVAALLRHTDGDPLTLARFQHDAVLRQLQALHERGDRGIVIGAGTGSGKTKAFYIPAFTHIAPLVSDEPWTKALAIYPRIELLKDQLSEAFIEARKLDHLLRRHRKPPIVIGAYYGDTPISAKWLLDTLSRRGQGWEMTLSQGGWIFPTMPCPECHGQLVWRREDVAAEARENAAKQYGRYARLHCAKCGLIIGGETIRLTRQHMIQHPPDILFTTTEMLNRRLSRTSEYALFGIGVRQAPRLMLLDEIHTYEGMGGAQVAHLLRRWRYARGRRPGQGLVVVGLSATLTQAETFFARLTGLAIEQVSYITPAERDLVEEGIEYNLVVKGDPVSGTSLLSTSVQTAMLLGRILDTSPDTPDGAISRGAYGQKIFAFTDTLDVINRWYHIEQDAETRKVLSSYRANPLTASTDEKLRQNEAGQWWGICERIGHDLQAPLTLDLTSSQYRGVRADAQLVIATSTLEVGFNDPTVGAVIQHKAPRSLASFLQRKGRAGRTRIMRPWMVVVTSAYGRDRWAFQHAENLFTPILPPLDLPLENIYVRKMQAAYALMDWLASLLSQRNMSADLWGALSSDEYHRGAWLQGQRRHICRILDEVLAGGPLLTDLQVYLDGALGLAGDTTALDMILWREPRPLLLEIIPTILRQLETQWQRITNGTVKIWADAISSNPMPDFVTPNLFSLLSLPELTLHIPESTTANAPLRDDEQMTLVHGMNEYAPGHVSKRYARSHLLKEAHWLALPDEQRINAGRVQLADLAIEREPSARRIDIDGESLLVYRPRAYTLAITPLTVLPTSSARLIWRSRFEPQSRGGVTNDVPAFTLHLAPDSPWRAVFASMHAFTQASGSWVEITRAAVGVRVDTRYSQGMTRRRRLRFAEQENPAAIGFQLCVDALCIQLVPRDMRPLLHTAAWTSLRQHLIPTYMYHCLEHDPRILDHELSDFEIGWLWQLELSLLVSIATTSGCDLAAAAQEIATDRMRLADEAMDVIFQTQRSEEEEDLERTGRLRERLRELLALEDVVAALSDSSHVLWEAPDSRLIEWLAACYRSSTGAALFDAVTRIAPDIDPDDLTLDIDGDTIWIAEQTPGGVGLIQRMVEAITRRPRDLDVQLRDTVRHCDREALAQQLTTVAEGINAGDNVLTAAFAAARDATDMQRQSQALRALGAALEPYGIPATRDLIVALNSKFLRPNADDQSDRLVAMVVNQWAAEQQRLGCAIDVRVMAVAAWRHEDIRRQVALVLGRMTGDSDQLVDSQVVNLLQSLLWLDCRDSCPDCIERGQPYQRLAKPSRALLRAIIDSSADPIAWNSPDWLNRLIERVQTQYAAELTCGHADLPCAYEDLYSLLVTPIEVEVQQHYPAIERIERRDQEWLIGVTLRDLTQR